jgi:hypothetical protein
MVKMNRLGLHVVGSQNLSPPTTCLQPPKEMLDLDHTMLLSGDALKRVAQGGLRARISITIVSAKFCNHYLKQVVILLKLHYTVGLSAGKRIGPNLLRDIFFLT